MIESHSRAWNKWRDRVDRQRSGGLSVAEFCHRHGLAQSSFFAWKRKLAVSSVTPVAPVAPAFIEARVVGTGAAVARTDRIQIRLRGGRRLIAGRGFDRDLLAEVVAVVEGLA